MIDFKLYQGGELIKCIKNIEITDYNNIIFDDENVKTSIKIEENSIILIRENEEYKFYLELSDDANAYYYLTKEDTKFNIIVENSCYKVTENYITIDYKIESNEFKNKIIIVKR